MTETEHIKSIITWLLLDECVPARSGLVLVTDGNNVGTAFFFAGYTPYPIIGFRVLVGPASDQVTHWAALDSLLPSCSS